MSDETTAIEAAATDAGTGEAATAEPITKIVSGDSVYPIRDAGALRDADGSVTAGHIADGAVTDEKLAPAVGDKLDEIDALRDSVSRLPAVGEYTGPWNMVKTCNLWYSSGNLGITMTLTDGQRRVIRFSEI